MTTLHFLVELSAQWQCLLFGHDTIGFDHNPVTKKGRLRCLRCKRVKDMPW
jgi:hypothetical protein